MNVLYERLPEAIEISGTVYDINPDFRNCLRIITAYEDRSLTISEKHMIMLRRLYKRTPHDTYQAVKLGIKFLNCGVEDNSSSSTEKRVYSFEKDAQYIYTAINQTHGIDLEQLNYLHWWKFCYLFADIGEDCFFSRMVYLRNQKNRGKLTKDEREAYNRIKNILDLPEEAAPEVLKAQQDFLKLLNNGG